MSEGRWGHADSNIHLLGAPRHRLMWPFQHGDRLYTSESDVRRRQILTYNVDPRIEIVKYL